MGIVTTTQLGDYRTDGTFLVSFDGEWFRYGGMTEQPNGDMLVHLRYLDTDAKFDIEVAKDDMGIPYWEA
jgi:hypothetical protein